MSERDRKESGGREKVRGRGGRERERERGREREVHDRNMVSKQLQRYSDNFSGC